MALDVPTGKEFLVACLCAEWCDLCGEYRPGFVALAARAPRAAFRWVDIEDEADALGDLEVENFPTVLVKRGSEVLFYGPLEPAHAHLERLLGALGVSG
jgi:hypothetical protein